MKKSYTENSTETENNTTKTNNVENKIKNTTRQSIIGLGEESFRKNYYPELQKKILELERTNIRSKALLTTNPDILLIGTVEGEIAPYSTAGNKNYPVVEKIMESKDTLSKLKNAIEVVVQKRELFSLTFSLSKSDDINYYEARIHISELDEILIIIRDVTERILLENKLRDMAERDSLTNLYNRRSFENKFHQYNSHYCENLSIILIDVDGLKIINDTLGHFSGDKIIIAAAKIIEKQFGNIGYVSRIGGDEFSIILSGYTNNEIEKFLHQMYELIDAYNNSTDTLKLSLSHGYSFHSSGMAVVEYMYQEADNFMYQNKLLKESVTKQSGKNSDESREARDYITQGHAKRMEKLATDIGEALHLPQNQINLIKLLAKFHDIGKVGIPDSILNNPTRLSSDEWRVMKTHCHIGERIASESSELKEVAHLILKHHEIWYGT
jgi:diguanylate cyclase (GGDEF)-like protein